MVQPLNEDTPRLPHQPGLHGITNLLGRGLVRQSHMQGEPWHPSQREVGGRCIGVQHGTHTVKTMARIQNHNHRFTQKWNRRAVAPFNSVGFELRLAFPGFIELFEHPGGFLLQGSFDLMQWHPLGRTDHQAIGSD